MTTKVSQPVTIEFAPGCQPSTDRTVYSTEHSTFSDKIRWFQGVPQKIGGWMSINFDLDAQISGICRRIYSAFLQASSVLITVLGTSSYLYALSGTNLTNITPLETTTHAISNSLATDFRTLAANPVATISGSNIVTISDANAANYQAGDDVKLSGFATTNGITNTMLNAEQIVRSVDTVNNKYTIIVSGNATSTGTGGGSSCVVASGLIIATATAHGMLNGQRTKILGATTMGGVTNTQINQEFILRNVSMNAFSFMTTGTATSAVTAGGGTGTTYQKQIGAGSQNEGPGQGYGAGEYGVGLYGTALISQNGRSFPRIWYIDRFQAVMMMTSGNQSGVYTWNGDTTVAPALLANAPTAVNYVFVSNDIVVTFGYQGVANQIFASDIQNPTNWTASSANQVFQDTISGAGPLTSHLPVNGVNLIFSKNQTYVFAYIGLPLVWSISLLSNSVGIIAPLARCVVNGVAYWMSDNNFYRWRGGNVEIIPANSQMVSTILNYVYNDLTSTQRSKIYAWYNERFGEIWFHYPSANSNEPNKVARVNVNENFVWTPDTFDRTAAESPDVLALTPRLASSAGILYNHERGADADGSAMAWSLVSNLRNGGKNSAYISQVVPDSTQVGDISFTITSWEYPQSPQPTMQKTYTVTPTTAKVPVDVGGRYWQYTWSGNVLGQTWMGGKWQEFIQETGAAA